MSSCAKAEQFSFSLHVNAMKFKPRLFRTMFPYGIMFSSVILCEPTRLCEIVSFTKVLICFVIVLFSQVCMDILCNIIRCTQPPLSEPLLNSVFPVVVNTILASDDNSVLQVQTWVQGPVSRSSW